MKHQLTIASVFVWIAMAGYAASVWTYDDCLGYARTNNISLRKSVLDEETAAASLEEAKAQWQPTLDFATSHGFSNYPWATGAGNVYSSSYGLNAGWTVWNGGLRENTIKRNRLQTEIAALNSGYLLRTLETDLLQVYINILYAREALGIYQEAVGLSRAQADRARQLMEAGKLSRVDYAQLQSQYEQDSYALVNAQGIYDSRRMELKKLLELGIDADVELADVNVPSDDLLADLPPMNETYALAVSNDLQLQSLEISKDGAQLDVEIAKADGKPRISLNAGIGTGYNAPGISFGPALKQNLNESVGLTLSVPILDNKKTRTAVAVAKVQQLDAELDIEQRNTELAQEVENWYIDTRSAQSRYSAAVGQLQSAELTAELVNERFSLGYVNTVEMLTAHNSLVEARHTLLQARYMALLGRKMIEYYRTTLITLN